MTNLRNIPLLLGFALCAVALLQMTAISLRAAPPGDRMGGVAVVDIEGLSQKYKKFQDENNSFSEFRQARDRQLQSRVLLNANEWDELDSLDAKKNLKPDETKRVEELRSLSEQRRQRTRELESKVNISAEDRDELDKLRRIPKSNQVRLEDLAGKLQKEVADEGQRLSQKLHAQVTGVYEKLGKSRGFWVVFDKNDVQWSDQATDITDEVLKQLNNK